MAHVVFNFAPGKAAAPGVWLWGGVLLLGSLLLAGQYYRLRTGNALLQQQLASRQSLSATASAANARQALSANKLNVDQSLVAEIDHAQSQIQTPWLPLLQGIEQAYLPSLYWMQLAPDARRKQIRMVVLAHQRQQGWALAERLKQQPLLANVKLKASESTDVNGLVMATIHLEAAWKF